MILYLQWSGNCCLSPKLPGKHLHVRQHFHSRLQGVYRDHISQFVSSFGQRLAQLVPGAAPSVIEQAAQDALVALPLPVAGMQQPAIEQLELQLVFRHDCL